MPVVVGGTGFYLRWFIYGKAGTPASSAAGEAELTVCPTCGQRVRRVAPQPVNSPKLSAPLSVSRARQAGFTVLKRTSGGEFEKQ